jgi:hypothetical protein
MRDFPAMVRPGENGWVDRCFEVMNEHDGRIGEDDVWCRDPDGFWRLWLTPDQFEIVRGAADALYFAIPALYSFGVFDWEADEDFATPKLPGVAAW